MVKKISGTPPPKTPLGSAGIKGPDTVKRTQAAQGPSSVESKAPVETAGVRSTQSVERTGTPDRSARIRRNTRPLSDAERQYLLELVGQEAEKMFGDGKLSPEKRKLIENSVKLTISAATVDDDTIDEDKKR